MKESKRLQSKNLMSLAVSRGWEEVGIKGSHYKFKKNSKTIIIPKKTARDMCKPLANRLYKEILEN